MSEYPTDRQNSGYAIRYIRWLSDSGAATEVGPDAFALLVAIATKEDELHYSRAPNFFNEQLTGRCGIVSVHSLIRARQRAIDAGLLFYEAAAKRRPGRYFVCGFYAQSAMNNGRSHAQSAGKAKGKRKESATLHTLYPIPNTYFIDWYELYPRKEAKPTAEKAYQKALLSIQKADKVDAAGAADLLAKWTQERVPALLDREPQYRPLPATWLNQARYRDELSSAGRNDPALKPFPRKTQPA